MFDECMYFNTSALARQLERRWAAAFARFGLTAPQAFLLRAVLREPGLAPFEIADLLTIARPTATRLIDGLVEKGLLVRRPSDVDGRGRTVHPTPAAVEIGSAVDRASGSVTRDLKRILGVDVFGETVDSIRVVRRALN
jgi:DNA-binding MarR family transcriptional regulator